MDDSNADVENTFRILVATDTHLGYMERHGERGDDSFVSFEEVLKLSWENNADFILLGGDLFHENKPSKNTMVKCIRLLKKYCLGDRPVPFEYVSDPSQNFSVLEPRVNYHDPNMNVAMPVFSIHGNHDDMSGLGDTAALDLLSEAGLVNYFGRCTDLQSIQISPILLQKGTARLAIYGLSNVKDDRLYRLMRSQQVSLLRPREHTDDWFSVMVLHQNRVKHSLKNYIPAEFLDSFLDVVIWGHEHENRIKPEFSESAKLHIIQPGSSVATSLCEGEARAKSVGLLEVRSGGRFQLHELPLRTVRPLVFDTLRLSDAPDFDRDALAADVDEYLTEYAEKLIVKAQEQITGHSRQPRLPLIRLRVEYPPEMPMFHPVRFGQKFLGRVANPDEMILLRKEKIERRKGHDVSDGVSLIEEAIQQERDRGGRVEDFVKKHFAEMDVSCGLHVLSEVGLSEAVSQFVAKGNSRAVGHILDLEMKKAVLYLTEQRLLDVSEEAVRERLVQWRQQKRQQSRSASRTVIDEPSSPSLEQPKVELNPEEVEIREYLETVSRTAAPVSARHDVSDSDDDCIMVLDDVSAGSSGRGRGRGRGSRGGGRGSRGRAAATSNATAATSRTKAASTRARGRASKTTSSTRSSASGVQLSLDTFGMASSNGSRVSSSRSAPKKGIFFDSDDGDSG